MLIWVGAGAVQPPRRALPLLSVLLAATLAPIAIGEPSAEARDLVGRALLFAAIGLVLIAYVAYVRAQRVILRTQEQDARADATAATKRVRDLQWITDAALPHVGLQDLLDQLLDRVVQVFGADQGAILLRRDDGCPARTPCVAWGAIRAAARPLSLDCGPAGWKVGVVTTAGRTGAQRDDRRAPVAARER